MAAEIERKFLVAGQGWREGVVRSERLRDGLIARFGDGKVRVHQGEGRAWMAVKGPRFGFSRAEFEYEIPLADAEEMLATLCDGPIIDKLRHCVPHAGRIWSVDVHHGPLEGLVLAEVELPSVDAHVELPAWIGREVTGDPLFRRDALLARYAAPPAPGRREAWA
jgi:adenylate cyclase